MPVIPLRIVCPPSSPKWQRRNNFRPSGTAEGAHSDVVSTPCVLFVARGRTTATRTCLWLRIGRASAVLADTASVLMRPASAVQAGTAWAELELGYWERFRRRRSLTQWDSINQSAVPNKKSTHDA